MGNMFTFTKITLLLLTVATMLKDNYILTVGNIICISDFA